MKLATHALWKLTTDLMLWLSAGILAYAFRMPGLITQGVPSSVWRFLFLSLLVMSILEIRAGLHRQTWQRVGIQDLSVLARTAATATLIMFALGFVLQSWLQLPRSVPILAGVLGFLLQGGIRLGARLASERVRARATEQRRRVLIVGAGEAGTLIAREMQRHPEAGMEPIGFLDDGPGKLNHRLMGLPVFGRVETLVEVARRENAQELLIATPSADGTFIRRVVDMARDVGLRYRIMPGVIELLNGDVSISQIRDVNLEDLLRRPAVRLNTGEIAGYVRGRVVLVTGAGGSIGSEIVRQLLPFTPSAVILLGRGENSIFSIQQEMIRNWPDIKQMAVICDVRDELRLHTIFEQYRPEVVFHAAAHKHVPLMEEAPSEAILNNVVGTQNIVDMCLEFGVSRLVNVSTDKAVNPTSVMGASKRVAELVVSAGAAKTRETQGFVSVRFGNVLGSRGSVVPTFMAQIRAGGPVTVTHPEMVRYFMTIPEAARLVLQAGGLRENGKVYVLDMGKPVKISDLAHDVIRLSGARNIDVVYSGVRPGEKLYEELLTNSEGMDTTVYKEIFSAKLGAVDPYAITNEVRLLRMHAQRNDNRAIRQVLRLLIPENKFGSLR